MDALADFAPPVREWFSRNFGHATPPQALGWPAIQRGEHTVILAPTGSGKTLAAFLWAVDMLFREPAETGRKTPRGPRVVYVSPLKALNNDVHRNLRLPLAGIRETAATLGLEWPDIRAAVRSGDTPQRERRALLSKPPHILITTPESLYLLLTSPRARELFGSVRTAIVDEIHTLAGNKRGAHFSLTLERLQQLTPVPFQRIGLSATIRPLEEVARFLGGSEWRSADASLAHSTTQAAESRSGLLVPRPVTIVDAGYQKALDLLVETVVEDADGLVGGSVWPVIIPRVLSLIREHRTTLVFANSRRLAERTADRLNEQMAAEARGEVSGLVEGGVVKGSGFAAAGTGVVLPIRRRAGERAVSAPDHGLAVTPDLPPFRAHHGSMARDARLEMERDLKAGRLRALVGTSSLELGIDIGTVDLVVQLQSPSSVAQGLQRVGRSGHIVGEASKGRIFPTHREDLVQAAVVAGGMLRGEVEAVRTPVNPLDVLAQQVVAAVVVEDQQVDQLFRVVRRSYAYRDLSERSFRAVLDMLSGRFPSSAHRELRPRIAWDRVNDRLTALPGSRLLALTNGGTIPDRGMFAAYLPDGKTRIGELDEEFVFETRVGDTFILGSQVWRVLDITDDRVIVGEAPGALPRMPFWHGDLPWRPYDLGRRVGRFRRELAESVERLGPDLLEERWGDPHVRAALDDLRRANALDELSARSLLGYVASQLRRGGVVASDRTVVVEVFDDAIGDPRMVVHSPFGGRVNGPWGMVLAAALRERVGVEVEMQAGDDGILFRFPETEAEFPVDLVNSVGPAEARRRLLAELPGSAVFGAQFRMNAARALLLPGLRGGKRTPFWLQRLRARDLLQVVRKYPDFPLLAETYRDCLEDVMDVPALEEVLARIVDGGIRVVVVESMLPSPVAQSLLRQFANVHLYEWDAPKAERGLQGLTVNPDLLQDLLRDVRLDGLLRPEAVTEVEARLQRRSTTGRARTEDELVLVLEELGDLTTAELRERSAVDPEQWLERLAADGRVSLFAVPTPSGPEYRWVSSEHLADYEAAYRPTSDPTSPGTTDKVDAAHRILERHLAFAGPVTLGALRDRYGFPLEALRKELEGLVDERRLARGRFTPRHDQTVEYVDVHVLEQMHRHTLGILRREVRPVELPTYAEFLAEWQHVAPVSRLAGEGGLRHVLAQLRGVPVVGPVWERDVLPLRIEDFDPAWLESLCRSGEVVWWVAGERDPRRARVRFAFRGEGGAFVDPHTEPLPALGADARAVYGLLREEGALFVADLRSALRLDERALDAALVELLLASVVTNDSLAVLRRLVGRPPASTGRRPGTAAASGLEIELSRRLGERGLPAHRGSRRGRAGPGITPYPGVRPHSIHRPPRAVYRATAHRVRDRLAAEEHGEPLVLPPDGRWSLVHRLGIMGPELSPDERALRQARQLLMRHGVVTRASLDREESHWEWPGVYGHLQRMELRGEVRRGYFVRGLPGVQFALPEALERLRSAAAPPDPDDDRELGRGKPVVLNACDPAALWGASRMGDVPAFSRVPSTWLVQQRGLPLVVAEDTAARLIVVPGADPQTLQLAVTALVEHLGRFVRRVTVESWNGELILASEGASLLEPLGFYPDHPRMSWERH